MRGLENFLLLEGRLDRCLARRLSQQIYQIFTEEFNEMFFPALY